MVSFLPHPPLKFPKDSGPPIFLNWATNSILGEFLGRSVHLNNVNLLTKS